MTSDLIVIVWWCAPREEAYYHVLISFYSSGNAIPYKIFYGKYPPANLDADLVGQLGKKIDGLKRFPSLIV